MKKIVIIILIIAALAVGAYFLFFKNASNGEVTFQYTDMEKEISKCSFRAQELWKF